MFSRSASAVHSMESTEDLASTRLGYDQNATVVVDSSMNSSAVAYLAVGRVDIREVDQRPTEVGGHLGHVFRARQQCAAVDERLGLPCR